MAVFNEPTKWAQTLGQDADVVTIPDTAGNTDPSIDKIFPSVFSIPLANGGRAIPRSVLNGLFKLLGDWIYYIQNGGIASYSASFDYAVGSFVKYNDEFFRCIQANGASTTVKAPTDTAYWSKITTLADVAGTFADQDLSNLSTTGQDIIDGKANISLSNVNDTANILMAHNSMPEALIYDDLTLGASGTEYTAPADGFFVFAKKCATTDNIAIFHSTYRYGARAYCTVSNGIPMITVPCKKGDKVNVSYLGTGNVEHFHFIYAVGSQSEKA